MEPWRGGAPRPCGPPTGAGVEAAARRGYSDACFDVEAALEAFDMSLEPFDIMDEAVLTWVDPGTGAWTDVVSYAMPGGSYGVLRFVGQDCNDATAYQRVSWRVLRNERGMGGDESGLIPHLEARCGIIDGTMMPFRFFIQPGGFVKLQARLDVQSGAHGEGAEATVTVRGRLQGERRDGYGVRS